MRGRIIGLEAAPGLDAVLVQPHSGGAPQRLPARAVFVQTGRRPALDFAPEILTRDEQGRLVTDLALQTNLPRLSPPGMPAPEPRALLPPPWRRAGALPKQHVSRYGELRNHHARSGELRSQTKR